MLKLRLGETLVRQGKLAQDRLAKALELQQIVGGRLGTTLLDMGVVEEDVLLAALAEQRATRPVSAAELHSAHPAVVKMVRRKLAERYRIVPYDLQGKTLFLASSDPIDPFLEDEIKMLTSCMVRSRIALELRIFEALEIFYDAPMPLRYGTLVRRLATGPMASSEDDSASLPLQDAETAPQAPPAPKPAPRRQPQAPRAKPAPPPELPSFIELDPEDAALLQSASAPADDGDPDLSDTFHWLKPGEKAPVDEPTPVDPPAQPPAQPPEHSPPPADDDGGLSTASIEERLADAARALQHAEIRDEIADVLLDFCAPYFERRMLLIRRPDRILGWRGGEDAAPEMVRAVEIGVDEASIFLSASNFWLGPLPPLPANENLILAFGGGRPKDCVVLPITLKSKIVCYLYGDNGERGVSGAPIAELKRLAAKAAIAFEVLIYKNKIRMI